MRTTGIGIAVAALLLASLGTAAAGAQWYRQGDARDRLRIQGTSVAASADVDDEGAAARFDAATGLTVAWEFRWGGPYGLELALQQSEHDFVARPSGAPKQRIGRAKLRPATLSFNRHWPVGSRTDLYAGLGISDLPSSVVELDAAPGSGFDVTSEIAPALQVGVDVSLAERVALGFGVRFVPRTLDVPGGSASWNAWSASVGVAIPIGSR